MLCLGAYGGPVGGLDGLGFRVQSLGFTCRVCMPFLWVLLRHCLTGGGCVGSNEGLSLFVCLQVMYMVDILAVIRVGFKIIGSCLCDRLGLKNRGCASRDQTLKRVKRAREHTTRTFFAHTQMTHQAPSQVDRQPPDLDSIVIAARREHVVVSWFRVLGSWFRVQGSEFRVYGGGFT